MAAENGTTEYPVIQELKQYPHRFSFYQAVSLLEDYSENEEFASVGFNGPCTDEALRFRPFASLGFSASDVKAISTQEVGQEATEFSEASSKQRFRIDITFMGLYGTVSPLPAFYTEDIIRSADETSNRRDFLDVFHHRAISLQYRILNKYRLTQQLKPGMNDQVANWLFALIGLHGVKRLEQAPLKRLHRLLANLGLLATQNRSGAMISKIVSFYFGNIPVSIKEFVLRDVSIRDDQQIQLGRVQSQLGKNMTLGKRVKDRAGKFRMWIGPLPYNRFSEFLPSGEEFHELVALTRYLLQDPLAFDVGLVLKEQEIPKLTLDKQSPCRLGWSSWLGQPEKGDKYVVVGRSLT